LHLLNASSLQEDRLPSVLQGLSRHPTNLKTLPRSHPPSTLFGLFVLSRCGLRSLWVVNCEYSMFDTPVEPSQNKGSPRLLTSSHHGSPRLQSHPCDLYTSNSLRALTSHPLQYIEVSLTEQRNVAADSCQTSHHDNSGESVSV
jgi:hypothetical protein